MFRFAKTAALALAGVCLVISCQKENVPGAESESGGVKYAKDVTIEDQRDFGTAQNWLGSSGVLKALVNGLNQTVAHPEFFEKNPSGIKVTDNSFVYVTYVGNAASYNNVLGYYTYTEDELGTYTSGLTRGTEAYNAKFQEFILAKIFARNPITKETTFKNVVYAYTRALEFGKTYQIGKSDTEPLDKNTIVGFYLLPNAGNDVLPYSGGDLDGAALKVKWVTDGLGALRPIFIATNTEVNNNRQGDANLVSHLMGRSACNDLVITFEDLNSIYSKESDYDYNDIVFVVRDNLAAAQLTSKIVPYDPNAVSPALDKLSAFGADAECLFCDVETLVLNSAWLGKKSFLQEAVSIINNPAYNALFDGESKAGYIKITAATNVYSFCQKTSGSFTITLGWYPYNPAHQTPEDVISSITVDGTPNGIIQDKYLIYTGKSLEAADVNGIPQGVNAQYEALNNGNIIPASSNIGFFITTVGDVRKFNYTYGRLTTLRNGDGLAKQDQAQLLMKGDCSTYLITFEDRITGSDSDYNDITISLTDNTQTLQTTNFDAAGYYDLKKLLADLGLI